MACRRPAIKQKHKHPSWLIHRVAELCGVSADDPRPASVDTRADSLDLVEAIMLIEESRHPDQPSHNQ